MALAPARDLGRAARWFHALADETRLRIIESLADGGRLLWYLPPKLLRTLAPRD